MRYLYVLLLVLMISGCAQNSYKKFYEPYDVSNGVELLKPSESPEMIKSSNINRDVRKSLEEGYIVIGQTVFNGSVEDYSNALIQAKDIGAKLVVVSRDFAGAKTINTSMVVPTMSTTYHSGSVYSSGTTGYYNGSSTSYGSKVIPMTSTQYRYNQAAVFFAKPLAKPKFGLYLTDLTYKDKQRSGADVGALVDIVIRNTPAYRANLVVGDVLVAIDGVEIVDSQRAIDFISRISRGSTVPVTILRAGVKKQVRITVP